MIAVLVEPEQLVEAAVVPLLPTEVHHLRVRRVRAGDPITLLDGHGRVGEGTLRSDGRVEIRSARQTPKPPGLVLAVGAGDRERFGWLAEKAAELDVTDLIPLETERTAGVAGRVKKSHMERLQRRATQAIKQSGAAWAPVVHPPHSLAELLARHPSGRRWLADRDGGRPGLDGEQTGDTLIVVGPEGGWTEAERRLLVEAGLEPVRFGANTLRFETAAIAGALLANLLRGRDP
ncbi:MAG TPA: RsmE family RNA methyltransferase [Gemmatimonadales bacterium]